MYPLKFYPILKDRIWGGTKLGDVLGKDLKCDTVGESWEISGVTGDVSVVCNGDLKGESLTKLIAGDAEGFLGKSVVQRFGTEFPILIKFIDAKHDLSVQVHPDDTLARARHNSFGKTEMWYIMDAVPGAHIIVGFKHDVSMQEYTECLKNGSLPHILHNEDVARGDAFFINAGRIHAIGAGVLLAEIQQTSDITYRVFDFNRRDKDGKLRELHTELALEAIDYERKEDFRVPYPKVPNTANTMVECPYFTTKFLNLSNEYRADHSQRDSFTIYMCTDGEASIENEDGIASIKKGETVMIPAHSAGINVKTRGAELLEITL
ncbi:MAG TPA: type I phosphomannose isomerase catalytic subunit [Eudoraea sp.]|nr:type I phosphomannose isomerase catalytic subunit [Eudoraea sp.]